ncbi:VCBS repeat-containing protein [Gemmata sp. JC673]|uniref:VCBS repeat-containing protein n=1 Tax=Gemmata algarum TaxID=2975278 RepID=A0ABU5F7U3_9BACT|nr:VCBS repeat-containing protein [Gemmata algarum]MDY3563673.1 VCBS repeat-containing protein [Gemmata algarum]
MAVRPRPNAVPSNTRSGSPLKLEHLEQRDVPAANSLAFVTFNGAADSTVNVYNASTTPQLPTITPFAGYRGSIVAATGDVNGDGVSDVIVGAQIPDGHVKVFDGATGAVLESYLAFPGFKGAVGVGTGDVNGDGTAEVLVSADASNAHVKAIGTQGQVLASFFAFPGFLGHVSVSGGDFNNDGTDEIVIGAGGTGVNGRTAIFDANGAVYDAGFFAFPGFDGSVSVDAGDVNGDGIADIVVGAGPGAPGGAIKAFSGSGFSQIGSFVAYAPTVTSGVSVRVVDRTQDGRSDIFVARQGGNFIGLAGFHSLAPQFQGVPAGNDETSFGAAIGFPGDAAGDITPIVVSDSSYASVVATAPSDNSLVGTDDFSEFGGAGESAAFGDLPFSDFSAEIL